MTDWIETIGISIPWVLLVGLLLYFIKNPEKAEKWGSILAKLFSFASAKWERAGVAKDIQADINSFAKKVNIEGSSVLPYKAKIKWISTTTRESFVKNGKVLIKMDHHANQARNFLYATIEWIHCGLVPRSRHLMDQKVLRSLDFAVINKILTETNRHDAKQLFISEIYEPEARAGSLLEKYCSTFHKLDEQGTFVGVALPEYSLLGESVGSSIVDSQVRAETISFAVLLMKLANKKPGEDVSPTHQGQYINCSIVLVAKYETYQMRGLEPYLKFINKCERDGIKSLYVCGWGQNASVVARIKDAYEGNKKIVLDSEKLIANKLNKSRILHFKLNSN